MAYIGKNPYTDAYTKAETDAKIVELSPPTKLSIGKSAKLSGSASVSNTTLVAGMSTTLYTGNGTTQNINAGVDLATQWGDTANETYGGLVWLKDRTGGNNHGLFDTVRGVSKVIQTSSTLAEQTSADFNLSQFANTGFTVGGVAINTLNNAYASWIFQTTHKITGTTNHGKAYTCHYNPITGFTIVKYEGSGIAGHEIPHHLGRKLGLWNFKNLTTTSNWETHYDDKSRMCLNLTQASVSDGYTSAADSTNVSINESAGSHADWNASGSSYILYGWANSYYDANNTLNGNYEIGVYQGTGASGNKITTRGKPAWVMVKRLDTTGGWGVWDNLRNGIGTNVDGTLSPNLSEAENSTTWGSHNYVNFYEDGFTLETTGVYTNLSGGQYLYMVVYDNDSASGKSKFNMASETSNLQLTNLVASFTNGIDANGVVNTIKNLGSFTVSPTGGWSL